MKESLKTIVEIIKEKKGLTQEDIAVVLGYKKNYISEIMSPKGKVSEKFLNAIKLRFSDVLDPASGELPEIDKNNKGLPGLSWEAYAKKLEAREEWYQRMMETSLAAVLKGVGELTEGQKDLLAYQEAWLLHLKGSVRPAGRGKDIATIKKDGKKTGTQSP